MVYGIALGEFTVHCAIGAVMTTLGITAELKHV